MIEDSDDEDEDDDDSFAGETSDDDYGTSGKKASARPHRQDSKQTPVLSSDSTATRMSRPTPMPIQLPQRMSGDRPFAPSFSPEVKLESPSGSSVDALSSRSLSNSSSSLVSPSPHSTFAFNVNGSTSALHASHPVHHPLPPIHSLSTTNVLQSAFGLKDAGWPTPLEEKIDAFKPIGGPVRPSPPGLTPGIVGETRMFSDLYGLTPSISDPLGVVPPTL